MGDLEPFLRADLLPALGALQHELLLFAGFWFLIGAIDDVLLDIMWLRSRSAGLLKPRMAVSHLPTRRIAVFIPAWQEADVITHSLRRTLSVWPHVNLRIYLGCYRNDPDTLAAAMAGAGVDRRVRIVVHDRDGPTSKADCLNRLWQAMLHDEARAARRFDAILLHDAEDLVHGEALGALDAALDRADFIQLPVEPLLDPSSRWISGHYVDEFAEAHGKSMPLRGLLNAPLPAAGVGCCFSRALLERIASRRQHHGTALPFAAECLTEDYEMGLIAAEEGARSIFLQQQASHGGLIATRAFFPSDLGSAVTQKTRWMHGIALQGWDRLGWSNSLRDSWMRLRDRRGPLAAIITTIAYSALLVWPLLAAAHIGGVYDPPPLPRLLKWLLWLNLASFVWRAAMRGYFTAQLHGWREGLRGILRIPVANIIAIMAGWRALWHYLLSLAGQRPQWNKTAHRWPADFTSLRIARPAP